MLTYFLTEVAARNAMRRTDLEVLREEINRMDGPINDSLRLRLEGQLADFEALIKKITNRPPANSLYSVRHFLLPIPIHRTPCMPQNLSVVNLHSS
jgi:hypothetical protein